MKIIATNGATRLLIDLEYKNEKGLDMGQIKTTNNEIVATGTIIMLLGKDAWEPYIEKSDENEENS